MASINNLSLFLRVQKEGATHATLQIRFIFERKPNYISTGIRLPVSQWDSVRGCLKINRKASGESPANQLTEETNKQISAALLRAQEALTEAERKGIKVTPQYLRAQLEKKPAQEVAPQLAPAVSILALWEEFIEHCTRARKVQASTIKAYKFALGHTQRFAKIGRYQFTFESFTPKVAEAFVTHLRSQPMADSTIGKVIKDLKVFCKWAQEHGHHSTLYYQKFKKPKAENTDFVYLTEAELEQVAATQLPAHLDRVRDMFVLQSAIGLRHSDLANLKPENRQGGVLRIVTIKTKDALTIPLSPAALAIYAKYESAGSLPKVLVNQAYNREIKEVCQLAGLTQLVPITIIRNGQRVDTCLPKYQKVTSHTARRTFIINALARGVRPEVLMRVTGHKDIKTLMRYVKITPEVIEAEFNKAFASSKMPSLA